MHAGRLEHLPYQGESPSDRFVYERFREEIKRGKTRLQLMAVQKEVTSEIRQSWSARSFTPVQTPQGIFDDVVCNISYHFNKHGAKYGSVAIMTQAAQQYFKRESSSRGIILRNIEAPRWLIRARRSNNHVPLTHKWKVEQPFRQFCIEGTMSGIAPFCAKTASASSRLAYASANNGALCTTDDLSPANCFACPKVHDGTCVLRHRWHPDVSIQQVERRR
jgi:hypothetical protein